MSEELAIKFRIGAGNAKMKSLRAKKGLYQDQLAKILGVPKSVIGSIEQCRVYPDLKLQRAIAEVLGTEPEILFPEWLQAFTEKWDRQEKVKELTFEQIQLDQPEVLALEADNNPKDLVEGKILRDKLEEIMDELPPRERKILRMRYGFEDGVMHTLEEVGREFDVIRERIRQIEAKALDRIRDRISGNGTNKPIWLK